LGKGLYSPQDLVVLIVTLLAIVMGSPRETMTAWSDA